MNSIYQSKFKKKRDFQYCIDSALNDKKTLYDVDICILDENSPQQTWAIKLIHQNFTELTLIRIRRSQWLNLQQLNLQGNNIRTIGCKYLTQIAMPIINDINLTENQVSFHGVHHLLKGNWPKLSRLQIQFDCLHTKAIATIIKGFWPQLKDLKVRQMKQKEVSLWAYWELMTIHNAEAFTHISIGNKKLNVTRFFKNLLHKTKPQTEGKIIERMKNRFVKLPQNYDLT